MIQRPRISDNLTRTNPNPAETSDTIWPCSMFRHSLMGDDHGGALVGSMVPDSGIQTIYDERAHIADEIILIY